MDLADRLRERLKREFGIETQEDLERELEHENEILDLGIFVTKFERSEANAS